MASIKCSFCNMGIHYHNEPNGTEFIMFPSNFWYSLEHLTSNVNESYRYLKSDAIELEFPNSYYKFWMCPNCKSIILFEKNTPYVAGIYTVNHKHEKSNSSNIDYIVFSDKTWDFITERKIKLTYLPKKFPGEYFIVKSKDFFYVYADKDLSKLIQTYSLDLDITHKAKSESI